MSVPGCFAARNSMFDVYCGLLFGVVGWPMKRYSFPVAPAILGLGPVLGSIAETNFRRAIMMDGGLVFLTRPLSAALLISAALSFFGPAHRNPSRKEDGGEREDVDLGTPTTG